jgi:WS/DGAT/MGAT family acyltransferase
MVRRGLRLATHPARLIELAETGEQAATVLRRLALSEADPDTALRGELGVTKRAAWSAEVPLDSVRLVGRRLGGTVNDVLLAAVTGALRRYLLARGETVDGVEIHAAIPVSLRSPGTEAALGNQVGAILLRLPVCLADPAERLAVVRRRTDQQKNSLEAPIILAGLKVFGAIPAAVETPLVDYFTSKLTAVMTNVIGPRERLYLAGAPVESFMFWVPKTGRVGLGVSFLSYAGAVRVGVISDAGLVPDPEAIVAGFQTEFDALLAQAEGAEEPASLRTYLSMLDDALVGLQTLLDSRVEERGSDAEDVVGHCQALTRAGVPCKNRPLPGTRTCRVHQTKQSGQ